MTLQQLQYAVTVASAGTITEAAERLYITQPSLTTAIRELEKEMNLTIFIRSNRGVVVSKRARSFLDTQGRYWSRQSCSKKSTRMSASGGEIFAFQHSIIHLQLMRL